MTTETELRHLLEMAAKAMGYTLEIWHNDLALCVVREIGHWNPHTDDGDSARMRSTLGIDVRWIYSWEQVAKVECRRHWTGSTELLPDHNNDRNAALRLCALRVAAAIGEGMG